MKLDDRIKELIAVGASVTANCQTCVELHLKKALESGAEPEEIAEAIEMGKTIRKGSAFKMDQFVSGLNIAPPPPGSQNK